jgi:hypothetical protein
MTSKKTGYDFVRDGDISILFIKNKEEKIFNVLLDTWNLQRVINFEYRWNASLNYKEEYYITATVYQGMVDGHGTSRTEYLQRFILADKISFDDLVDHRNNNKLDNRESNLRISHSSTNLKNRMGLNKNNKSGYRNVSFINGWYRVQLQMDGKNYMFPEKFESAKEAGIFAEAMRLKYYGEFAGNE